MKKKLSTFLHTDRGISHALKVTWHADRATKRAERDTLNFLGQLFDQILMKFIYKKNQGGSIKLILQTSLLFSWSNLIDSWAKCCRRELWGTFHIALRGCWTYFVTDWNSGFSKFAWRASFSSHNMAAPYVEATGQHNAAARLIRRARVPIVSLILLWKISLT